MKFKNKLAALLLFIGIGIVIFTFLSKSDADSDRTGHLDQRNHLFAPEIISDYIKPDESYDALVLFVVADELCSSCINEIVEYTDAVSNYINSSLNRLKTLRYGFIVGDDSTDYKEINYLVEFPFSSSLIEKESHLAKKLKDWKQDISGMNQIVLIDLKRNEVVGRIGIFTTSTTPIFKKNLVQQAFYELERQNKSN